MKTYTAAYAGRRKALFRRQVMSLVRSGQSEGVFVLVWQFILYPVYK